TFAVFSHIDGLGAGTNDGHAIGFKCTRQFQGRLATILHDHAHRVFFVHDFQHVFERERLEIKTVGRIVVGGNRFRVAVDHDGFVVIVTQGQGGMHAAVVELYALANTVGAATKHDDF